MPVDFDLPEDLVDSVDIVYLDDELDNLEDEPDDEVSDPGEDIDPIEDKSIITFKEHTRSVFRVNLNHANTLAISGGEDDLAFIWDIKTGDTVFECTGHKDSVTECSFSHDDKYVATGDMSGLIQVWNVENKNLIWCYEGDELEWLIWHHSAHVLLAGVKSGEVYMWQIPQGNCKVFPTNGSKVTDGKLLLNGTQLITGYEDGNIQLWDLKSTSILHQLPATIFNSSITNLVLSPDDKLVALCGSSAGLIVLKTSDLKVVALLKGSEEIECAAFCGDVDLPILASGSLNGEVCIWDMARQTLRHKTTVKYSITKMHFGANALLFVSCMDGFVYVYSGRTGELLTSLTGHQTSIMDMALTKDSSLLLTASDDETSKVFHVMKCLPTASTQIDR